MKFRLLVFFSLLFSLLFSLCCAAQTTLEKPAGFTVTGHVLQDPSGQPLRKVEVQLNPRNGQLGDAYSATTDAEGKFQIENVLPGRYAVTLDRLGFVQPGHHSRLGAPLELKSKDDAKDMVLRMQAAAVITGKIADSDGDPIRGVNVQATRAGSRNPRDSHDMAYDNTNDLGEYRLAGLRPGPYLISATATGNFSPFKPKMKDPAAGEVTYIPTYYPGTADKSQAVPIDLHPGDETPVSFTLMSSPTFVARGTITRPPGASFVQVMLRSAENPEMRPAGQEPFREDGVFEFRGLLPGRYNALLMVVDLSARQKEQTNNTPQMQVVPLSPSFEITNTSLEGLHLVPEAAGQIRGQFRIDKGQKIDWSQLAVMLTPIDSFSAQLSAASLQAGLTVARVKTDGSFEMKTVPAGTYRLAITSNSNNLQDYFTKAVNLDGKDVGDTGFAVSGGIYSLEVVVSAAGATVEGKVVDAKGQPVPGATVVGAPTGESRKRFDLYGQETTDPQGHFTLRGLNPGEYTVIAWEELEDNPRDPEVVKLYEDRGEKVQLDEGARKNILVKVIPEADQTP
jgi:protocatechuate 3,4-dioxygenase beta subunit